MTFDVRKRLAAAALRQDWISDAAAVVCIAANFEKTEAQYGERGHSYVLMEAGAAAENVLLEAVALDLGATMVGAFDDNELARLYNLPPDERPICIIPVGKY